MLEADHSGEGICKKYKRDGRVIVCEEGKYKSQELAYIQKEAGFSPTEADALADYLVDKLNTHKDFDKYYRKYMKW